MEVSIFSKDGSFITTVKPLDSSELVQASERDDYVRLNFILITPIDIPIGSFIILERNNRKYTIQDTYSLTEEPTNNLYECVFKGELYTLSRVMCRLTTPKVGGGMYRDYKFSLTGNAQTFLLFIVDNLQSIGTPITAGTAKQTGVQTIEFSSWNCLQAISQICETLGCSWFVEAGVLHFDERAVSQFYTFQTGILAGSMQISRARADTEEFYTRVIPYGSTKNLPPRTGVGTTYDGELLSEQRLGLPEGELLENNTELYGVRTIVKEFEQVFPSYTGTVTSTVPPYQFTDLEFPFILNEYLLEGITPKITFLTGHLIGRTFNVSQPEASVFILDTYTETSGEYPNAELTMQIGDAYTLTDIYFPAAYITAAQSQLREVATAYLNKVSSPQCSYEAVLDEQYLQLHNIILQVGDVIRIVSPTMRIDGFYAIKELTCPCFTQKWKCMVKFGTYLPKSLLTRLKDTSFRAANTVSIVQKSIVQNTNITNTIGDSFTWKEF